VDFRSATVYIATTVRKGRRLLTVRGKAYRLAVQPDHKFFGAVEVESQALAQRR